MKTRICCPGCEPLKRRKAEKGSILIALIVTMAVFAALGAAVVPLFSSSYMSKVSSAHAAKAYYMAESGFRYAASRYLHAASSINRDDVLENELHDATFTLSNNEGRFSLEIEGYFYKYNSHTGTNLMADAFGRLPDELPATGGSGHLMIPDYGDPAYPKYVPPVTYTGFTKNDDGTITFSGTSSFSNAKRVFPAAVVQSASAGSLTLKSSTGQVLFPAKSGSFKVFDSVGEQKLNGDLFLYEERTNDTLTGITNATDPTNNDITSIVANDIVALQRSVKLISTGTFGTGIYAGSRELFYNVTLEADGLISTPPEHVVDLDDLVPLSDGVSLGVFEIESLGGDDALGVAKSTSGKRVETIIALGSGSSNHFYTSWNYAGKFLNYDAQVKIGIGAWDNGGFIKTPPYYYMAGLSTRVRGEAAGTLTSYGISFFRASIDENDGIPDSLVPHPSLVDTPLILLWDRGGRAVAGDIWLAYMELDANSNVLDDDIPCLKDWSTIVVRMVEAASIEYTYTGVSAIAPGDIVTGENSGAKGYVIKKIGTTDSTEVLLLNNVYGTFSEEEPVSNGTGEPVTVLEWRPKDNYIWAFYGDTGSTGTNDDPTDTIRGENQRSGNIHWLPAHIDDWSSSYDHFTMVEWNSSLNTSNDSSLRRMGTGKELNGIIRTDWYVTPSEIYDASAPELGLHALGDSATEVYFDDPAYYIREGHSGPAGFIDVVVLD